MSEAKGSDGTITIEADEVVLTFSGFATHPDKRAASPRRIPLSAISAVVFTEPKGMKAGALRLVLAGEEDEEVPKAAADINAVQCTKGKSEPALRGMAETLRSKIGGAGAVAAEIAGPPVDPDKKPGFVQRAQEAAAAQERALAERGVLFQGQSHESGRNSTVTLYEDRLERVKAKKMSALSNAAQDVEVTPVRAMTSVQAKKDGMAFTKVTVYASGNNIEFRFPHAAAHQFKDRLMKLILRGPAPVAAAPAAPPVDLADQLGKLAALRDSGVLTEDEFAVQKARLLA